MRPQPSRRQPVELRIGVTVALKSARLDYLPTAGNDLLSWYPGDPFGLVLHLTVLLVGVSTGPEGVLCVLANSLVLVDLVSGGGLMAGKESMKAVANGRTDPLQILLGILKENSSEYCVIERQRDLDDIMRLV